MEEVLLQIIAALKAAAEPGTTARQPDAAWLGTLLRDRANRTPPGMPRVAKRNILPFYLGTKANDPARWASWEVDPQTERALLQLLRTKPRRTASGVATVTVVTKPWPCTSDCLYCPNDVRMPKSYLADEPACQRAERNFFDPYLQVRSRLRALREMGHVVDKVELIVLGGTWSDYPDAYQRWFVRELFRAVSEFGGPTHAGDAPEERDRRYRACGLTHDTDELASRTEALQRAVDEGSLTYNQAVRELVRGGWDQAATWQQATMDELLAAHAANEDAPHRVVGLTIETRPDLVSAESARELRALGCTKVQMGIQSLDQGILDANGRRTTVGQIAGAFAALRLAGFKIQVHFMANLLGATPEADRADYLRLVEDPRFLPDEVKLYPCSLVASSRLMARHAAGEWEPYTTDELIDLLVADTLATPAYTRISRMVRDISASDIVVGNRKANLRQMVEARIRAQGGGAAEIRMREVATADVDLADLRLDCVRYGTTVSEERFLQWVTGEGRIAGFLRLSLPTGRSVAMIREVHVYGRVAGLGAEASGAAQHAGLGRRLVEEACRQARAAGYAAVDVISSVGTRNYYRKLGFVDAGLYQRRDFVAPATPDGTGLASV